MNQFTTQSGRTAIIHMAGFKEAMALKNAVGRELTAVDIDIDSLADFDVKAFLPAILKIDTSPAVYDAIMPCLNRCLYNGAKITEVTFEDAEARGDYYELVIACAKENLSPFFKNLVSRLLPMLARFRQATAEKPPA
jgi:hypothetical protein